MLEKIPVLARIQLIFIRRSVRFGPSEGKYENDEGQKDSVIIFILGMKKVSRPYGRSMPMLWAKNLQDRLL